MEREPGQPYDSPLLPEDALPCVWMTAGLVAYKLCDREYECENCPYDAALQGGTIVSQELHAKGAPLAKWEFREDRSYHRSHGWIQQITDTNLRYGLDIFAGRLLAHATSVVLPPVRSRIIRDRPACWVVDEAELIPLRSPVSGTVTGVNMKVQHTPSLLATSPYDDGWLLEVECSGGLDTQSDLFSAEEIEEQTLLQLKRFHQEGLQDVPAEVDVGPTLADGGEPVTDLRRILGTRRYYHLVLDFLS